MKYLTLLFSYQVFKLGCLLHSQHLSVHTSHISHADFASSAAGGSHPDTEQQIPGHLVLLFSPLMYGPGFNTSFN